MQRRRDSVDLTPREAVVLAALLEGNTSTGAAKAAGISRSRVDHMRIQPKFRNALAREVSGIIEVSRNRLLSCVVPALKVLVEVMLDKQTNVAVRVQAASTVINSAFRSCELASKISEVEIRAELDKIQEQLRYEQYVESHRPSETD